MAARKKRRNRARAERRRRARVHLMAAGKVIEAQRKVQRGMLCASPVGPVATVTLCARRPRVVRSPYALEAAPVVRIELSLPILQVWLFRKQEGS